MRDRDAIAAATLNVDQDDPAEWRVTLEMHPRGLVIYGALPTTMLEVLEVFADRFEWNVFDAAIGEEIGADFVLTGGDDQREWREELGVEVTGDG